MSLSGKILYHTWYRPISKLRDVMAAGGPIEARRTELARRAMEAAATQLPPLPPSPPDGMEVHFLTGRRFWYQTAFCFWTLCHQARTALRAVFYDDGTFDDELATECLHLFPGCRVQRVAEIDARLDHHLPVTRFSTLRERRAVYPNLRKLTDVHVGASGWRLVLDSDMLFFRRPDFLLDWLAAPDRPLHMVDVHDSYGYPRPLLESLAGAPLPLHLNVGLCGLRSEMLDWDQLEHWCRELITTAGTSYYLEQALVAMLLASRSCAVAPADDYRLMPTEEEARHPTAVMHHYVDLSKRGYFRHAWKVAGPHMETAEP